MTTPRGGHSRGRCAPVRPAVATDAAGRVQIFYRSSNGAAWRVGQNSDYQSFATSATLNGGIKHRPTAALAQDGRLNVFVVGTDNALWVAVQTAENADSYTNFQSLGGSVGVASPIADHMNLLHAFFRGNGSAQHLWDTAQSWA
ncbi:hypothetical protein [Streptomyces sp. MN6]